MEEAFRKGQDGGIVMGISKVWSLACADDIVLIANKEEELKAMMRRL